MVWINLSAVLHIFSVRFNPFLLVIAVFSFYLIFTGYRVLYRKLPGQETWFDWAGAIVSVVAGIGLVIFGATKLSESVPFFVLCTIFGLATTHAAYKDIRWFLQPERINDKMWWFYHHMTSMIGAYIAAITAFTVNVVPGMIGPTPFNWVLWIAPGVIFGMLNAVWQRSYKRKFRKAAAKQ